VADEADPIATQLAEKIAQLEAEIAERVAERDRCRTALKTLTTLPQRKQRATMEPMHPTLRQRYSESAKPATPQVARFMECARKRGFVSANDVAKEVGLNRAYLSMMLHGSRPARPEVCEKIRQLIGYEVTKANWPDLRG
jgi:hypothetical protein